jgi:hypothetical protein
VSRPRFLAIAPNGDILVSRPSVGVITLIRPRAGSDPAISTFASGLQNPHDMVFHTINGTTWLYVSEQNQIDRYLYTTGDTQAHGRQILISGLPDASLPELRGAYEHYLKNIALGPDHSLYVSIASSCNACASDTQSDPVRGAIYRYDAVGGNHHLFARGLRNAEGLAFVPGSNTLWAVVNNRDNIAFPFHDGTGRFGTVFQSYVDNHPPDEFTSVIDGANYGWPFCNPDPNTAAGMDDMPFDADALLISDDYSGTIYRLAPSATITSALVGRESQRCLDVYGASHASGTSVIIWDCHGSTNQQWTFPPVGVTGTVRVYGGSMCLDDEGARGLSGDSIIVWPCHGGPNQQWTRLSTGELRGINGKCVDAKGAATVDGTKVILWTCTGGSNQKWDPGS